MEGGTPSLFGKDFAMQHTMPRKLGRVYLAVILTLTLLVAPAAWATPLGLDAPGWFGQLWDLATAWITPAESGPTADPSGLGTEDSTPVPFDPDMPDASEEDGDRGATADPSG